jgi:uncharacterized membrane protein YhaH (DUF805 family)
MINFLFSGRGRVRRTGIWLFLVAYMALHTGAHFADHSLGWTAQLDDPGPLMMLFSVVAIWPTVAVSAKRFHDRGMSGWWVLWFFVLTLIPVFIFAGGHAEKLAALEPGSFEPSMIAPSGYALLAAAALVQLIQFVILFFLPGQKGENRYGPDPRARR